MSVERIAAVMPGVSRISLEETIKGATEAARILIFLSSPTAVMLLIFGLWRLGADLGWTSAFPISDGVFSHWQLWIAMAFALKAGATFIASKAHLATK